MTVISDTIPLFAGIGGHMGDTTKRPTRLRQSHQLRRPHRLQAITGTGQSKQTEDDYHVRPVRNRCWGFPGICRRRLSNGRRGDTIRVAGNDRRGCKRCRQRWYRPDDCSVHRHASNIPDIRAHANSERSGQRTVTADITCWPQRRYESSCEIGVSRSRSSCASRPWAPRALTHSSQRSSSVCL